ncbi:MAG: zinc ribbon domain-containing protein [Chloroflexi bacterium]|nr:zinc ribbon domain-containing protein [Chloroflexota bacterium]
MTIEHGAEKKELLAMDYLISLPVRYDAGAYMGRFLKGLINKEIWANKCPKCGRISVPPRALCGRCLGTEMGEWLKLGDEGTLESFEVCFYDFIQSNTGQIQKAPWVKATFIMDHGAIMEHYMVPPDPTKHKVGDRYKVVWNESRIGEFHDILHFVKKEE